jgi:hypothetical protein
MAAILLVIFGGALAYALYGLVVGLGHLLDMATGRHGAKDEVGKLPRGLHIAGRVTSVLAVGFILLLFWVLSSAEFKIG